MLNHFYSQIAESFPETELAQALNNVRVTGAGGLPAWFAMTDMAVASIGAAGVMLARLVNEDALTTCTVDRRHAALWFKTTLRPMGWELPPIWNQIAGVYPTQDGWIRLHTNVAAHRAAALSVLGTPEDREAVAAAVATWEKVALMDTIVEAGGCAAAMNDIDAWRKHPQGAAVEQEPLVHWDQQGSVDAKPAEINPQRPLAGIRILDLTRILAGPISTRFLAAYGADVLRIDPPGWDEPANIPEVVLGKRCAGLDLRQNDDRAIFELLIQGADVLVHGYRYGALAGLGYDSEALRALNPTLIDVSLNAYGWTGPWTGRRGFDSLVQMNSGIADYGMKMEGADAPYPLPAQALDHTTGYLMAAAVLHALHQRHSEGTVMSARLSLARTAAMLIPTKRIEKSQLMAAETESDIDPTVEQTDWGAGRRVRFPLQIGGIDAWWSHPATKLHSAKPQWEA